MIWLAAFIGVLAGIPAGALWAHRYWPRKIVVQHIHMRRDNARAAGANNVGG